MRVSDLGTRVGRTRCRMARRLVAVAIVIATVAISANPVAAQEDVDADGVVATSPEPAADDDKDESLLTLIVGTGPTGWLFMGILLARKGWAVAKKNRDADAATN